MEENKVKDKFKGVWLSHSSINDFLNCPRLYYLRAMYKDPLTGHKITRIEPPLVLGQVVHDTIDSISTLPVEARLEAPLMAQFDSLWKENLGEKGGFKDKTQEDEYYERGRLMIQRIIDHPGPLAEKAVKITEPLPWYWISDSENLILCGKVDWLIYKQDTDSVHILDFKTGRHEEKEESLQLPIYHLLVKNTQKRAITGASYWYLFTKDEPTETILPSIEEANDKVMTIGRRIRLARQLGHFECKNGIEGCRHCAPLEAIKNGKGKKVGESKMRQDLYIL